MITKLIGDVLGWLMYGCYKLIHNYGISIIVFTLLTKIVLLPISIMVQKNSIKMVKMYPDMNRIKAKYYGNKDMISEEQYKLYKKEKYHPMLDLVPIIMQLIILMGVVDVIYRPISHLLHVSQPVIDKMIEIFCSISGTSSEVGSIQVQVVEHIASGDYAAAFSGAIPTDILNQVASIQMKFLGVDLGAIPVKAWGITILIPILAALSAWLMCYSQNKINVLQSEQSKMNQMVTLLISVGLSLYLGFFVPAGVGLYWIFGNLFSVLQLVLLNWWINPKNYIDYAELKASKQELSQYDKVRQTNKKDEFSSLEKQDYKRFMKYGEKQLVFYSEKNGFYKYFQNVIEVILRKTDIVIHYITSDPKDEVFKLADDNFRVYYIGDNKLIILMMKMEADMVVMTMPDLQKYQIKRSMVKSDIEYVYMDHGIGSLNMMLRKHAIDYFDTIFAANQKVIDEIRKQEEVYSLSSKNIVEWGSGLIDNMIVSYNQSDKISNDTKTILIAPSWQEDNILDSCIEDILDGLLGRGYRVIVRPHPQYVRHFSEKLDQLADKFRSAPDFVLQRDFASNDTVFKADILITDWSGIAYEYSFATLKPTLFINTTMKVMNLDYKEIDVVPFDIEIRDKVGISLNLDDIEQIGDKVNILLKDNLYSKEEMEKVRDTYLFNVGNSGSVGANYIIKRLIEYSKR